eukprot:2401050-Prymnesium_polylepis.1
MRQPRLRAFLAGSFQPSHARICLPSLDGRLGAIWGKAYLMEAQTTAVTVAPCKSSDHVDIAAKLATHEPAP